MAEWYNYKLPVKYEEKARIRVKEIVKTYKTVEEINRYLIDNIEIVSYYDEEDATTTAGSVLVLRRGDSYGFCNAMLMLLEEIGVTGEPILFKNTMDLTGVIVNGKIYVPAVQKVCERNDYGFDKWLAKHEYEKPTEFVRTEISG